MIIVRPACNAGVFWRGHERAHFDQASAILDSNSEQAQYGAANEKTLGTRLNMAANSNMAANLRSRALKKTPALQAIVPLNSDTLNEWRRRCHVSWVKTH